MKLYLISQYENTDYDTYDSAVVCAETEEEARMIHPGKDEWDGEMDKYDTWCAAKDVKVELIGIADDSVKEGVVCASFNAG